MNGLANGGTVGMVESSVIPTVYLPLVFLTVGVGLAVAAVAVRYRSYNGALCLALFAGVASGLTLTQAFILARTSPAEMELLTRVGLSIAAVLPATWLLLVLGQTGAGRWTQFPWLALLFVEPATFAGVIWIVPELQVLVATQPVSFGPSSVLAVEFGLVYWAHQLIGALYILAGGLILAQLLVRKQTSERRRATALLGAGAAVLMANASFSFGLFPAGLDPTGVVGVFVSAVLLVVLFANQLRAIAPAARVVGRETVLDELDDAIVMLDESNRVLDTNPAGKRLLENAGDGLLGRPIESVRPEIATAIEDGKEQQEIILQEDGTKRYYDLRVTELSNDFGTLSGTVISLRDISAMRRQRQRLDVLNRLLRHNIRNEMNVVGGKIELAELETENSTVTQHLSEAKAAVDTVVDRSNKVGRLSRMLDTEQPDVIDIGQELHAQHDAGGFDENGADIRFSLPESLHVQGGTPLLAAFEELVSNAVVHNDSPSPTVTVTFEQNDSDEDQAVIAVRDNGPGIDAQEWQTIVDGEETPLRHSSGVGLWLVNWVVDRAGGSLSFETGDGTADGKKQGSTVRLSLPRAEPPETA